MGRICFLFGILVAVCLATGARAEPRVALVMGNSAYESIAPLRNPRNDAELMSETLRGVGFQVITVFDTSRRSMARAVRDFGSALRAAGPDAVGLFYYAGHGVQHDGHNYLLPVGTDVQTASDLTIEALRVSDILAKMAEAENALNLVILDACRNNPFPQGTRSTSRGLARVSAFSGAMVAFSAGPGEVALDGSGDNSPYTQSLAAAIQTPGLSIEQVFKRARQQVHQVTDGRQTPWEESSLIGDFYFTEGEQTSSEPDAGSVEAVFWDSIRNSDNIAVFEEYLRRFPNGTFAILAQARIDALTTEVAVGLFPPQSTDEVSPPCDSGVVARVAGVPTCLRAGDEFRDCDACPVMVVIPPGRFLRGAGPDDPDRGAWEKVQHEVTIGRAFAMAKFETTFAEWDACVRDGGCANQALEDGGWGRGRQPLILVPWTDISDYTMWMSQGSGTPYRLPSEAEWEYAARAGHGNEQVYHFGSNRALLCQYGNIADAASSARDRTDICDDGIGDQPAEVGRYAANGYGLHDTIGNVWEWTQDCVAYYDTTTLDGQARTTECRSPDFRIRRGGAYDSGPAGVRSVYRYFGHYDYGEKTTGFRVLRELGSGL